MQTAKPRVSLFTMAVLSVLVLAALPVSAHGAHGNAVVSAQSTEDTTVSSTDATSDTTGSDTGSQRGKQLREKALLKVTELRQEHKSKMSATARQKVCENRLKAVSNKLTAFNNAADKHLNRLDDVFTKLQDYQSTNNITADNYDALVTAATEKQAAATQAVAVLKDVGTTLDCTADDPAASLQATKTAAADTRDALKDYRKSLKGIVVALMQAKGDDAANTDDNGGEE
jgi:chromosome segregation ATPase